MRLPLATIPLCHEHTPCCAAVPQCWWLTHPYELPAGYIKKKNKTEYQMMNTTLWRSPEHRLCLASHALQLWQRCTGQCAVAAGSAQPCPELHSRAAHLAISIALFIMLNALPCCNEEEFWFSASVVNLVDFGDFLMQ